MAYTGEVLRYLRRKDPETGEFEPITWLGSEQRFVGALRNSGINNLEEQYVLGTNTYRVSYKDNDGNTVIEKHFCINDGSGDLSEATNYYKVITTVYKNLYSDNWKFVNNGLQVSMDGMMAFGDGSSEHPNEEAVYCDDINTFTFTDDALKIYPDFIPSRVDRLYFVKNGQPDLLVLTKITKIKTLITGQFITHEQIINGLNPGE